MRKPVASVLGVLLGAIPLVVTPSFKAAEHRTCEHGIWCVPLPPELSDEPSSERHASLVKDHPSASRSPPTARQFGPFHRLESPTQTASDAAGQQNSRMVMGKAASHRGIPSVKAYRGRLPDNARGVEFWTNVAPTTGSGSPLEARWYVGTDGVSTVGEFASIPATTVRNYQT